MCNLNECLVLEIRIGGEKCFFSCLYRSPSQGRDEFESFYSEFDLFLSNINDLSPACCILKAILMLDLQSGGKYTKKILKDVK